MNVAAVGSWLALGVGVVAIVATVYIYLRSSVDKGTISSLQNSVAALETESRLKSRKIEAQGDEIKTLRERMTGMARELDVWRNAVTAKEEIAHLQTTLESHHEQTVEILEAIRDGVTR